ncbi:hypothetical protein [Subtercola vilae]|uniref:Transmembrane Fragile-X-F protein n=1 Tax=Subtercola vilae TaxID=2056433 RepID=A0A4T2BTC2_9MICO|nr:hypothetical protein [Subtercola vilae]TIH32688.1 hypothetical protein D4765_15465 [Subtercola vilae]
MSSSSSTSGDGIGFAGLLTIVFIVLKLTHVIDWSWWWVLAPVWITCALSLGILAIIGIGVGVIAVIDHRSHKRNRASISARRNNLRP